MITRYILKVLELYGFNKSVEVGRSVDAQGEPIPWYTYPAIEYLSALDFKDCSVFEFGSGSSSIWWAKRAKEVYSVESSKEYYDRLIENKQDNNTVFLIDNNDDYSECIVKQNKIFDIIVIDGKRRLECIEKALPFLSPKGMLIFDNSDRALVFNHYKRALQRLNQEDFIQVDFKGFTPINMYTAVTSIFFKRDCDLTNKNHMQASKAIGSYHIKF
ncbi:MAG: hypothetical protein R3Y46_02630 [Opitutales bacterium]